MIVGVDVGFSHVKTATDTGLNELPAVVAPWEAEGFRPEAALTERARREHAKERLRYGGRDYLVGAEALRYGHRWQVSLDRDWVGADVYRVLLLAALQRAVPDSGADLTLVTGLPIGDWDRHHERARTCLRGQQKIERLPGGEPWEVTILEARVMPQPFGTLLAQVLDDTGQIQNYDLARGRVGVIDIGFRTTDYLTVDGLSVVPSGCLSRNTGMADVLLDLSRAIQSAWGLELDPHALNDAVLRRTIHVSGRPVPLDRLLDPLLDDHARMIIGHATMLWGRGQALQAILITGGGGEVLGPRIAELAPHARLVPNARFQNAIGYLRYGRRLGGPAKST